MNTPDTSTPTSSRPANAVAPQSLPAEGSTITGASADASSLSVLRPHG